MYIAGTTIPKILKVITYRVERWWYDKFHRMQSFKSVYLNECLFPIDRFQTHSYFYMIRIHTAVIHFYNNQIWIVLFHAFADWF